MPARAGRCAQVSPSEVLSTGCQTGACGVAAGQATIGSMHDFITVTIEPLGDVTLACGQTWGAAADQVARLFRCTAPLRVCAAYPAGLLIAESAVVGSAPLIAGARLFIMNDAKRLTCRARLFNWCPVAAGRRRNRGRPTRRRRNNRSAQLLRRWADQAGLFTSGSGASGSGGLVIAASSRVLPTFLATCLPALGSVVVAYAMGQPTFALFGLFGLLGILPGLLERRGQASRWLPKLGCVREVRLVTRLVSAAVAANPAEWQGWVSSYQQFGAGIAPDTTAERVLHRLRLLVAQLDGRAYLGPQRVDQARTVVAGLRVRGVVVQVIGPDRAAWRWVTIPGTELPGPLTLLINTHCPASHQPASPPPTAPDPHRATATIQVCGCLHHPRRRNTGRGRLPAAQAAQLGRQLQQLAGAKKNLSWLALVGGADEALPAIVPLAQLLRAEVSARRGSFTSRSQQQNWKVPLGLDADGRIVHFDLINDGPHLLVAGTTGSGKSVVLRSLIIALADQFDASVLALALVDFKGGASFGDCLALPQVVGQVTDLDTGLAERALAGLRAELIRRKQVLQRYGAADIVELPIGILPRLVVVFDEFRALTEELPDAIPQLFRIAAQGRSLGIHLILATQRAAGAVSPEVRANVSARLALRVVEASDSLDLVDSPLAANLPAIPGRAVLRLGAEPPLTLQCAWADAASPPQVQRPDVPCRVSRDVSLVTAITARNQGLTRNQPPLWLPPLPSQVELEQLAVAPLSGSAIPFQSASDDGTRKALPISDRIVFGLADFPEQQAQLPVGWSPASGHLGIIGRDSKARSATLDVLSSIAAKAGWQIHLLRTPLATPAAMELLTQLIPANGTESLPNNLLLVDNAERWRDVYEVTQLITVAAEYCAVAVTSGSAGLNGFAGLVTSKLILLSTDTNEDLLLGAPNKFAGKAIVPGRSVWLDASLSTDPALCQIAAAEKDLTKSS